MHENIVKNKISKLRDDWIYQLFLTIRNIEIEAYLTKLEVIDNFLIATYDEEEDNNNMTIRIPIQDIESINIKNNPRPFMPNIFIVTK